MTGRRITAVIRYPQAKEEATSPDFISSDDIERDTQNDLGSNKDRDLALGTG